MEQGMNTTIKIKLALLVFCLITAVLVRPLVLGSGAAVDLPSAPALTGQISQSFAVSGAATLPVAGKDYALQATHYFEKNDWVVTTIKPLTDSLTDGFAVLQKQAGQYVVVAGPGSAFSSSQTAAMPDDVALYLRNLGAVYDPN
jgi:hypothetical protein